ncbi:MAG: DUF4292 domain-containing protein [Paludibacteraceae bacterium]|nr:DUF4292 domain-containing protein [Paludibacteraceae bacterium]
MAAIMLLFSGCASQQVGKKAETQWHTMQAKNVRTTLWVDQKTYTVNCTYQAVRDSMIVISVRPLLGIEVARVEATPKKIVVIDKVHGEYTPAQYKTLNLVVRPKIKFKDLQDFISGKGKDKDGNAALFFKAQKHNAAIKTEWRDRIKFDEPVKVQGQNLTRYKEISLMDRIK